jgi:hypothetical protein
MEFWSKSGCSDDTNEAFEVREKAVVNGETPAYQFSGVQDKTV